MRHQELVGLGRGGLQVSRLGLGTAPLGGMFSSVEEEDSDALIAAAIRTGIRYFDTAPLYGHGRAERRLGRGLASLDAADVIISSKIGRLLEAGGAKGPTIFVDADPYEPVFAFSGDAVRRSIESSLERLGRDRLEIVFIHDPEDHTEQAVAEAYPVLHQLRDEGVIASVGIGTNFGGVATHFVEETDIDVVLIAGRYTLLDQSAQRDLLPAASRRDVSVIAAGVFNSGVLVQPDERGTYDYAPASPEVIARARALHDLVAPYEVPVAALGLQFPLRHPAVPVVLTGARNASELEENVRAMDVDVPAALWEDLDSSGLLEVSDAAR